MSETVSPTKRTKLKRIPKRGNFDRKTIYRILDEGFVCYVGFAVDDQPFVLPTAYARVGDEILIHGSSASRMMKALRGEIEVCLNVTLIDGLVLARSAFHHSMNYRSVVVFGKARMIEDEQEKINALRAFTQHIIPHRWSEIRHPNAGELKATLVLSISLQEASAKIRGGDPVDDAGDYAMDVWAGVIPLNLTFGEPVADSQLKADIPIPPYLSDYK